MGAYESVVYQNKSRHWNKPIDELYSSVKISENFPYSIKFIGCIRCNARNEKEKQPFYFLVTEENVIHALSYDTAKSDHSLQIDENIKHICQVLPYAYAITMENGAVKLITNYIDKFEVTDYDIQNTAFCIPCDTTQFIAIGRDYSARRISFKTNEINAILAKNDAAKQEPVDACVLNTNPNILVVLSSDHITCASFGITGATRHEIGKNMIKITTLQPNNIIVLADDGMTLLSLKINNDGKISPSNKLTDITSFHFEDKILTLQSRDVPFVKQTQASKRNAIPSYITTISSTYISVMDHRNKLMRYSIPEGKHVTHILMIPSTPPNLLAAACEDGSIFIIRIIQETGNDNDGIESFKNHELENFHHCKLKAIVSAFELMFLTIDENGRYVTWESFPDWWCAPYYFEMFNGSLDDEEDQEENNV